MTYLEHLNDRFDFGKFSGKKLGDVLVFDPKYLIWVVHNVGGRWFKLLDSAIKEIELIFPNFIITEEFESKRCQQLQWEEGFTEDEFPRRDYYIDDYISTYERYNGSYAQDEMGYSDDDIDTIFDGSPSAYWNID